jgi:hypothetical protein
LALPEGSQWGEIGKNDFFIICCFWYFNYENFFVMYLRLIKFLNNADVVPFRPPGSSPIQRHGEIGAVVGRGVATEDIEEIEHNLEGLTMNIPDITVDELPRCYQCHTVGMSASIGRLLHHVAWEVILL